MGRTQLNLRLDGKEELIEAAKKHARSCGMTLTDFVVFAIEQALQSNEHEKDNQNSQSDQNKGVYDSRVEINNLRLSFMQEMRKRDERLNEQQESIVQLAYIIAQMQLNIDEMQAPSPAAKSKKIQGKEKTKVQNEPSVGMWESVASTFLDEVEW